VEQARDIDTVVDPLLKRIPRFLDAVKFQESVFALPFAYSGMVLAADGWPTWSQFAWITVAMVSARTLGMSANRIVDRHIDARNPRTAMRHLPAGMLRFSDMTALALVAAVVFFIAAAQLNTLALALATVAAGYLIFYPFAKRFTWAASFFLGWALAIAPSAAWIGVRGSLTWEPVLLSTAVALWAASFDILYHAQDHEFYTKQGLYSVARRFGVVGAFRVARTLDILAVACLVGVGALLELAVPYYLGCAVAAAVMVYKYRMVSPTDLSRMGIAFMRTNAFVSLSVFVGTVVSVLEF
jgi:4-hydroxybenzoate polyprenyltransferase